MVIGLERQSGPGGILADAFQPKSPGVFCDPCESARPRWGCAGGLGQHLQEGPSVAGTETGPSAPLASHARMLPPCQKPCLALSRG